MADRIKGITVEIGGDTTGLSKALSGVNKEINGTQSSLKDVERLLKMDPGNTELLRQKYDLLNKSIESTDQKLETLKEAERQVQAQFERGEVSEEQYNALKREIIATEASLRELKSEAKKTDDTISRIDEGSIEDVEDAAEDAGDELEEAGKKASVFGDALKADAIVEGAKSIISSLKDVAEETKEYQKIMGSLQISSEMAGYTADETAEIYKKLYGVLGDDQTTATTTANLQALGYSQDKLNRLVDGTIGAWAKYGDSIPIDGLAEAINETVKVGTVTGTLADVLNWAGKSEDDFNFSLEQCTSDTQRANLIFMEFVNQGLMEAGEKWREQNELLVQNNESQAELQAQLAELGKLIMPMITEFTKIVAKLLEIFNSLDDNTKNVILKIVLLVASIGTAVTAFKGISAVIMFLISSPLALLIISVSALVILIATSGGEIKEELNKINSFLQNIFAKDWREVFGNVLGSALNAFCENVSVICYMVKTVLVGIINFLQGLFTGNWKQAWTGLVQIFEALFGGIGDRVAITMNGVIKWINKGITGVNTLIKALNKLPGINIKEVDKIPLINAQSKSPKVNARGTNKIPYLANGGVLERGSAIVGEAGPELLTMAGGRAVVQPLTSQTKNNTMDIGGVTLNVYGAPGQNEQELARIVANELANEFGRREAAFG